MKAMLEELQASGMSEDEILEKTQLLMKAFGKEDSASTAEYKLLRWDEAEFKELEQRPKFKTLLKHG